MSNLSSERLKALREARKLTMQELADKLGVSKSMISYYEKGKKTPSVKTIDKMADTLNVSVDYLIGKSDAFDGSESTSKEAKDFMEKFEKLDPAKKEALIKMLEALSE